MTYWILILVALVLITVLLFYLGNKSYDYGILLFMGGAFTGLFAICVLAAIIITPISISNNISVFESQSQYLSTHAPKNAIEDAAITSKKVELNEWLYSAKWAKNKFGAFSFYPDEILNLEPIQ